EERSPFEVKTLAGEKLHQRHRQAVDVAAEVHEDRDNGLHAIDDQFSPVSGDVLGDDAEVGWENGQNGKEVLDPASELDPDDLANLAQIPEEDADLLERLSNAVGKALNRALALIE